MGPQREAAQPCNLYWIYSFPIARPHKPHREEVPAPTLSTCYMHTLTCTLSGTHSLSSGHTPPQRGSYKGSVCRTVGAAAGQDTEVCDGQTEKQTHNRLPEFCSQQLRFTKATMKNAFYDIKARKKKNLHKTQTRSGRNEVLNLV